MKRNVLFITAALMIISGAAMALPAGEHALTSPSASWTTSLGVIFEQGGSKGSGVGTFEPFVRIGGNGTEQGYNTDYRPAQFNEKDPANWWHALSYSRVPIVMIDGAPYREFKLDINQAGGNNSILSLDIVKLYETNDPNIHDYPTAWPTPITILNWAAAGDDYISLDARLGPGLGGSDMSMYVPETMFTRNPDGTHVYQYITLYSKFGIQYASNDGYEDWGIIVGAEPTPEPSGLIALVSGATGLAGLALKRRRQ